MNKESVIRMKSKAAGISSPEKGSTAGGGSEPWEVRPCGMLVQRRSSDSNQNSNPIPNIKVRVKYGKTYHEVTINSQASFGELKKMIAGQTGLPTQDMKLIYKDRERDSKVFLDVAGVKNGSRILLVEDEFSKEKRLLESQRTVKMEKASKEIAAIRIEVDKLAKQVASVELEINCGKKVVETVLLNLIELLMKQLINLDGISADGDVKLQRRMQVKRVQKYIEILDALKIRNSEHGSMGTSKMPLSYKDQQDFLKQGNERNPRPVVVTTKWETF